MTLESQRGVRLGVGFPEQQGDAESQHILTVPSGKLLGTTEDGPSAQRLPVKARTNHMCTYAMCAWQGIGEMLSWLYGLPVGFTLVALRVDGQQSGINRSWLPRFGPWGHHLGCFGYRDSHAVTVLGLGAHSLQLAGLALAGGGGLLGGVLGLPGTFPLPLFVAVHVQ